MFRLRNCYVKGFVICAGLLITSQVVQRMTYDVLNKWRVSETIDGCSIAP